MKTKQPKEEKGLSDSELITKYEEGEIDMKKVLKPMLKKEVKNKKVAPLKDLPKSDTEKHLLDSKVVESPDFITGKLKKKKGNKNGK